MWKSSLAFALIVVALPLRAQETEQLPLPLADISGYVNALTTAKGSFTQINDDGSQSSGMLYIKRPGRMRFEYDPPNQAVVVAGGGALVIFDPKSNQTAESYPLKRTPLSLILNENVDFGAADAIVGHVFDGIATVITAQDSKHPEYGQIDLIFDHNPVRLGRWVIRDGAGGEVTVVLGALKTGVTLSTTLFNPRDIGPTRSDR